MIKLSSGRKTIFMPRIGINIIRPMSAAATPWWLSGGISAANCVAAYAAKGAVSYADSLVNLATLGVNDAVAGVAPSWSAITGWTFTAAQYLLAGGIVHGQNWSFVVRFSSATIFCCLCGANSSASTRLEVWPNNGANKVIYANGTAVTTAPLLASGVLGVNATSAYRNGVADGVLAGWFGMNTVIFEINGRNTTGGSVDRGASVIQALALYNTSISASQHLAVATAIAAL